MRSKDPELKKKILAFVQDFYDRKLRSPSMSEIGEALGINKSTASRYLVEMDRDGMLEYTGREIYTKRNERLKDCIEVPVVGSIPCGTPEEQEAVVEGAVSFPKGFLPQGEYFMLKANGDSMVDAGINNGDSVIVRKQENAVPGDIVAALVDNHTSTLKRLVSDGTRCYLHPENASGEYQDIMECFSIQGVAVEIIKRL